MSLRSPEVSIVLATYNRRSVLVETLAQLDRCGLSRREYEIIVVDNASTDGTVDAIADRVDALVRLKRNAGSCAKAYGARRASGRFILFLDDDSFPRSGSLRRMLEHFAADDRLGAAGFAVHLPDGREEGSALPDVFVGCGVGLRADALREVGGLDSTFFMQAEEYDLAFRLVGAGWKARMFPDLHVEHRKTAHARCNARTAYFDVRNNLRVIARYLPGDFATIYRQDWLQRYRWLAKGAGHERAWARGRRAGRLRGIVERWTFRRWRLGPSALEQFFRWQEIAARMADLAATGVRRIVLADLGKNVYPFYRAAQLAGVTVLAIGDDRFAAANRQYRGIPIVPLDQALTLQVQAVVVANTSSVHGTDTYRRLVGRGQGPVEHWFSPTPVGSAVRTDGVVRTHCAGALESGARSGLALRGEPVLPMINTST